MKPLTILYFGNDWAAENRTSSHHVARWLARRHNVIYVECPGLRAPKGNGRDLGKLVTKLRLFASGPRPQPEGLEVQTLLQVPLHGHALVRAANHHLITTTLRWLLRRVRREAPGDLVTWFVVPHLASIAGTLGEKLSVYYCIDDYAALPDVDPVAVRAMDDELTRKADLVFVAAQSLLDGKRSMNPNVFISPHGVDFDHFVRAQDPALAIPEEMQELGRGGRPVIGFFGLIERWIDLDLVAWLADQRPQWSFAMVGRLAIPGADAPRRPNLTYLGRRPYEALPAYGKAFDAAIIPYKLTQQVLHANPIKLREYLAMGKPIVSVSTPEIDRFASFVRIAHAREAFLAHLDAAVAHGLTSDERDRQTALASTMTWDAQLTRVLAQVEAALRAPGERAALRPKLAEASA